MFSLYFYVLRVHFLPDHVQLHPPFWRLSLEVDQLADVALSDHMRQEHQ